MAHSKNDQAVINIKITKLQRDWLTQIASQIRDLIGIAIDLLNSHDIDWDKIRNIDDLRRYFDL
jgi:hypothetical protein